MSQFTMPLNNLKASPQNVRKTGGATVSELAASIRHQGLINPLSVTTDGLVVAGSRRLQAFQLLAKEGHLADDHPVPCTVVSHNQATEISLAENVMREAMHPADEFDAYQRLVTEDKLTPAEIAERFGVTERHVLQRLRLARVAPEIIDDYRTGAATLDQVQALAVVDDTDAQRKLWKATAGQHWRRTPAELRKAMVEKDVALDSALGKFVGRDAYEAAGGEVRPDLFSDMVTLPNGKLVRKLAQAKLDAEAKALLDKGWGWAEGRLEFPHAEQQKFRTHGTTTPSDKLGVIVTLDGYTGKIVKHTGLLKPGQKAPPSKKGPEKKPGSGAKDASRETVARLYGIRTAILRKHLRANPSMALAAMAASVYEGSLPYDRHRKKDPTFCVVNIGEAACGLGTTEAQAMKANDVEGTKERARWEKRIADGQKKAGSVFAWLLSEPEDVSFDLLAWLTIESVDATTGYPEGEFETAVHEFAAITGVEFADEWSPTLPWFQDQPRAYVVAAVSEACGPEWAKEVDKQKGPALFEKAYELLSEKNWIPKELRKPAPPAPKTPAKKAAKKSPAKRKA